MTVAVVYLLIFFAAFFAYRFWVRSREASHEFNSLKTVTFGDESAVKANRFASIISVVALFAIWGAFTGSVITPLHVPGPFKGDTRFTYTATDDATVLITVHPIGENVDAPALPENQTGFARDDAVKIGAWRSGLVKPQDNDEGGKDDGYAITAIDGQPIAPGGTVRFANGDITMTARGSLSVKPDSGWQMEPIWLPPPEAVVYRLGEIASEGYKNFTLWQHLGWSLWRVVAGFGFISRLGLEWPAVDVLLRRRGLGDREFEDLVVMEAAALKTFSESDS